ncbi:cell adhesion molecule 3 isoform X2 [Numida meleagris]|uniref:cell adhesion molecule 3 isoform X2 n=1 Tax=Numida meleagris TaxID=8996 RepID=UPI000B3E2B8F|nr:cell adhesion molecule 3 isoform X2 [Numida meleagris]
MQNCVSHRSAVPTGRAEEETRSRGSASPSWRCGRAALSAERRSVPRSGGAGLPVWPNVLPKRDRDFGGGAAGTRSGMLSAVGDALRWELLDSVSQPTTSDETVVAGGTVVLKCQVEDPDDSSLQWSNPAQQTLYFGEKRALRDNRIQLVRSTPNELTISISNVMLVDEGEYTCSIFTMPVRTAKALVTVLGIPQKPQIFGHEQPIDEEKIARLTCRSSGSKPAAQLRWKKGNKELKAEGMEVVEDSHNKTFTVSSRVEFRVTKEDDNAEVTCTVDHESLQNSERSTTQKLQVHYKPTAKIEPQPQYPREGEKLQLQCDGQGNPVPREFLWEKEGSDPPQQLSSERVLIFPFLNKSDSGTYICTATSSMGSVIAKYNLDVSDASPVLSTSSTYHAVIGGVVAVIVFLLLSLLIVLGHYLIRHKGTYLTHEAKGSDDAPDADTAIINAEGGQAGGDDKKEYFI